MLKDDLTQVAKGLPTLLCLNCVMPRARANEFCAKILEVLKDIKIVNADLDFSIYDEDENVLKCSTEIDSYDVIYILLCIGLKNTTPKFFSYSFLEETLGNPKGYDPKAIHGFFCEFSAELITLKLTTNTQINIHASLEEDVFKQILNVLEYNILYGAIGYLFIGTVYSKTEERIAIALFNDLADGKFYSKVFTIYSNYFLGYHSLGKMFEIIISIYKLQKKFNWGYILGDDFRKQVEDAYFKLADAFIINLDNIEVKS